MTRRVTRIAIEGGGGQREKGPRVARRLGAEHGNSLIRLPKCFASWHWVGHLQEGIAPAEQTRGHRYMQ